MTCRPSNEFHPSDTIFADANTPEVQFEVDRVRSDGARLLLLNALLELASNLHDLVCERPGEFRNRPPRLRRHGAFDVHDERLFLGKLGTGKRVA